MRLVYCQVQDIFDRQLQIRMQLSYSIICHPGMKKLILAFQLILFTACSKTGNNADGPCQFTIATITDEAPTCQGWGIVVVPVAGELMPIFFL